MKLSEFDYILPPELIAQSPAHPRDSSKLLVLNRENGEIQDRIFSDIFDILGENDVLVVNKTRVINARLPGYIETGLNEKSVLGVEIFLHKKLSDTTWDCLVFPGKKLKVGTKVQFWKKGESISGGNCDLEAQIISISEHGRVVEFNKSGEVFDAIVDEIGEIPLPPYIKQKVTDPETYQTIYREHKGSVAAPTAGLHFTSDLFEKLEKKGVKIEKVLLHVGLGTFKGVEVENIEEHSMHTEYCSISQDTAKRLNEYKQAGKRIIAVGTTSVRTLESFTNSEGLLEYGEKETNIFIYPGYTWRFVESIITNFHLPKSTLLMLVSSFAGKEYIKNAYLHAVDKKYRFFSFGDAMFIK